MAEQETTALSIFDRIQDPMTAIEKMGKFFAESRMFGCDNAQQGQVLALASMCERKNPLEIIRTYHLINNKLAMRADAMLAEFRKRGGKVEWKKFDDSAATALWTFDNNKGVEISFTAEDAKKAGYLPAKPGSGWAKNPDAMLRARCISKAIRMLCPEAVAGTYTPEEVYDFEPEKTQYVAAPLKAAEVYSPELQKHKEAPAAVVAPLKNVTPDPVKVEAPKPTAVPAPAPAGAQEVKDDKAVKVDGVLALIAAAGQKLDDVLAYLVVKKYLQPGQTLGDCANATLDRILAKPDPFFRAVAAK